MKIRTAIFAAYVAASAVGFVVLMTMVLRDVRLRYIESMRRTMGDAAAYLAAHASGADGAAPWTEAVTRLPRVETGLRVFATDREGRVVFDSAGRDAGRTYAWNMTGGGPHASENYTLVNVAEVDGEIRVAAPVRRAGEQLGWVGVGRPISMVDEGVKAARWDMVKYAGTIALIMIVTGWWISTRLTHSLERLTAHVRAVREGDRRVAPPPSRATEIAALGRAFEEMRESLEGRQRMERYTQALTHEVKAPLAAIRGAAELLDEDMPDEQRRRFLGNIRSESARIQQIVERLLELSSLEARKALYNAEEIEAGELLESAVEVLRPAAEARRIAVAVDKAAGAERKIRGERVLLREALVNLLQNALDFAPAGSRIQCRVWTAGPRLEFSVEDEGPGVPDFALPRVFERFYSLPRPQTGRKSTGLGLSLVREIAHLHGGDATLQNRQGGGARAVLVLPLG